MNALIATLGSYGDVYPFVGLGAELARRGHAVTLFTNPLFEDLARSHGLSFCPLGTRDQYASFAEHPDLFHPRRGFPVLFETLIVPNVRSTYERLLDHTRCDDTVVVSSVLMFGARLAQETHGIPNVTVHLSPMALRSAHEMPRNAAVPFPQWLPVTLKRLYWRVADRAVLDRIVGPPLNDLRGELGLAPVHHIMSYWAQSPSLVIGLFPPWYAAPQPDWPPQTRLTGFPLFHEGQESDLSPDLQRFLAAGEPPIVFMPGSLMRQAQHLLATAVEACRALGRRAILLSRYREQIPAALPETIRYEAYVPLGRLLPAAAALVHHGGIGTTAQSLRAGVPQLIHPMAYDQADNAWRLKRLGAGDWIAPRAWEAPVVARSLHDLITSGAVRDRCRSLAQRFIGAHPLAETCRLIESLG